MIWGEIILVYTITLNPSLDYIMGVGTLEFGEVNRSDYEKIQVGGKGINVSAVLKELGVESTALGFAAGFTGTKISADIEHMGIKSDFIFLSEGTSRINVKLKSDTETDINGNGPQVSENELEKLLDKLKALKKGDVLVASGSATKNAGADIYERIVGAVSGKGVTLIVDTTGDFLISTLKYSPFMVKPNLFELRQLYGQDITSDDEIISAARSLIDMGAQNVIVSMDARGALLVNRSEAVKCAAKKGKVINSTGAGDSLIAGFVYKYLESGSIHEAFDFGVFAGTAAAFSEGLATRAGIDACMEL